MPIADPNYELALDLLHQQVNQTNRLAEFLLYRTPLLENLGLDKLYGRTPVRRQERAETLLPPLERLALAVLGVSFTDLAFGRRPRLLTGSPRLREIAQKMGAGPLPFKVSSRAQPRRQDLPFNEITWEQFEAICFAYIETQPNTLHAELYGVPGGDQRGIDILAHQRTDGKGVELWVYQCKRYKHKKYTAALLEADLTKMTYPADYRVVMLSFEAPAKFSDIAAKHNTFLWDARCLARKLKSYPDLVEEFFGRELREAFSGPR
jgi:hypothetical protein